MRVLYALMLAVVFADVANAQQAAPTTSDQGYATVASAMSGLRAKSGVKISVQSGWTLVEDPSTLSLWSFAPQDHAAYPAAVHRKVIHDGGNIFIKMNVLCEAPKAACDSLVNEFQNLNEQVRKHITR